MVTDKATFKMCSRFAFSNDEFELIKQGSGMPGPTDLRWYISTTDNVVSILRTVGNLVAFKIPFEKLGDNYISEYAYSVFDVSCGDLEKEIQRQNYRNYWIYSWITQLIFHKPRIFEIETLLFQSKIDFNSVHGFIHWSNVNRIGTQLSTDIDLNVLFYFSVFHDFFRLNDYTDVEHGKRAKEVMEKQILYLDESQRAKLLFALENHDLEPKRFNNVMSFLRNDKTVRLCIDSDRLDLGRVGVQPSAEYLLTEEAKEYLIKSKATL